MELLESQKGAIADIWEDPTVKDLLQKALMNVVKTENIPLTVGQMLQLFEGMDTYLSQDKNESKELNANV